MVKQRIQRDRHQNQTWDSSRLTVVYLDWGVEVGLDLYLMWTVVQYPQRLACGALGMEIELHPQEKSHYRQNLGNR